MAEAGARRLTLRIVTPEASAYDGEADLVVVPGHDGETAFLPRHAPFVGLLGTGELRFRAGDGATRRFFLAGGVVQTVGDVVTVLAEDVVPAEGLDPARARAEFEAAAAMPGAKPEESAARTRALASARAKARLAAKTSRAGGKDHR